MREAGEIPDPREAQLSWLEAENTKLRERLAQSEQAVDELTDFRSQALARLAAQHEEIVRLRESAAGKAKIIRLPAPRPQSSGPAAEMPLNRGSPHRRSLGCQLACIAAESGPKVLAQSLSSSRNEAPFINHFAQFGHCQPAVPVGLTRVRDQGLRNDGLMHPEPDGANPLPEKELEQEAHRHTNAQFFSQLADCRLFIRLAHVHGPADHRVVVARKPGQRLGPPQHEDPAFAITTDRRCNAMQPVLTHSLIPLDDPQYAVVLIDMLNQFAHRCTISVPTDSSAPRATVMCDLHHRRPRRCEAGDARLTVSDVDDRVLSARAEVSRSGDTWPSYAAGCLRWSPSTRPRNSACTGRWTPTSRLSTRNRWSTP